MKIASLLGPLVVLLSAAAASAQVVGGYSTIVPTQIGQTPVFDSSAYTAPTSTAPTNATPTNAAAPHSGMVPVRANPVVSAEHVADDQAVRTAALEAVADKTHSVLKPVSLTRDVTPVSYQAPATFQPQEEKLAPIPVSYTGGTTGAAYYPPSLAGQVVPVQASAPVTITQSGCCTPCVSCCMPVAQTQIAPPQTVVQQPATVVQPQVTLASVPSQLPPGYIFGRGLLYQPVVYVEGQPVRNFLRFISP